MMVFPCHPCNLPQNFTIRLGLFALLLLWRIGYSRLLVGLVLFLIVDLYLGIGVV